MLRYDEALGEIRRAALHLPLATELCPLTEALGRVLATELIAPGDLPHWDNSAMDGFALRSADTAGASPEQPLALRIVGTGLAGEAVPEQPLAAGEARAIMTGAPMPPGADSVVKVEDVQGRDDRLLLQAAVPAGQFVRRRGEDFRTGQTLLQVGHPVTPAVVMLGAALGIATLTVWEQVPTAIVSTGNELVDWRSPDLKPAQIRNSSQPFLAARLAQLGCDVRAQVSLGDDPVQFEQTLRNLWGQGIRLILTTGAVSMGEADFVPDSLGALGCETRFHRVAIRPGKPVLLAIAPGQQGLVFACPGNPISTAVTTEFFLRPLLRQLRGETATQLQLPLAATVRKPEGLRCFFRARLTPEGQVEVLGQQSSAALLSLVEASHWAILLEAGRKIPAGTPVALVPIL